MIRCGWIPDPADFAGDGRPEFTLAAKPAYTQAHGPILLQDANNCVAFFLAGGMRDRMAMQGTVNPRLPSHRWIYWWARKLGGEETVDNGSQPSLAVEGVNTYGWCAIEHFDSTHGVFTEPGPEAARYAFDQRGKVKIHRLYGLDDIKLAIAHDLGVGVALQVDKSFEHLAAGAVWNGIAGAAVGGHMFRLVGYDDAKRAFVIMNSWGDTWADGGFGLIGYEAATNGESYAIDWVPSPTEDNPLGGSLCAQSTSSPRSSASCSGTSSRDATTLLLRCPTRQTVAARALAWRPSAAKAGSPLRLA